MLNSDLSKKNSNSSTKDLSAVVGGMVSFPDCHRCVVWHRATGIVLLTKYVLQMGDSQILLKWTVVRTAKSWKALCQCSELFYWGGKKKKKGVIWALNDLNDKSEASHLYATFVREICWAQNCKLSAELKGMKIKSVQLNANHHCSQDRYWLIS